MTLDFHAFNLDLNGEKLEKVENLPDRALFIGCQSIFVSTKDLPEFEDNSIYFLGDYLYWSYGQFIVRDVGVHNIREKLF